MKQLTLLPILLLAFFTTHGQQRPCEADSNYRHFDFWIGEWDVFARGKKAGVNIISLAEGGCALHESYTTPTGYSGQSINYYSRKDKKWHQVWVDSNGGVLEYVETESGPGMLQFECEYLNNKGELLRSRLTFTANADGTVRQLFEDSKDEGKTWTPGFDGLYKPKN